MVCIKCSVFKRIILNVIKKIDIVNIIFCKDVKFVYLMWSNVVIDSGDIFNCIW